MKECSVPLIDELKQILASRNRRVIDHPPFSHAAVLVPLYQKEGQCHLLFTKRSDLVKYHKGEISFPGGMVDEEDHELVHTALREAYEEIGLKEKDVQIIGLLDDIVTTTQFIVTPIVGLFPYPYPFRVSEVEIAELIEVPLTHLLDENSFRETEIVWMGQKEFVYAFQYEHHTIWGATARILKQFLDLISSHRGQRNEGH